MDFTQTPPGMLALDNMLYFAKHHQDAYIRVSTRAPPAGPRRVSRQIRRSSLQALALDDWPKIFGSPYSVL